MKVSGASLVIDSSKTPILAWLLHNQPEVQLAVLHVTRDPRAVAFSWKREKFDPAKETNMEQRGALATAANWVAWNALASVFFSTGSARSSYKLLRYEDFAAAPIEECRRIFDWLGRAAPLVLNGDNEFVNRASHTIAGNPMRFSPGHLRVQPDDSWRTSIRVRDNILVTAVTLPILSLYGYRVR